MSGRGNVTSLLAKMEVELASALESKLGQIRCVKGMYRLKLISSENNSGFKELIRNIAHAEYTSADRISKRTRGQSRLCDKDRILAYGILLFRVLPSAFLLTRSNPRRPLKSAQEQEDRRRRRNKRDRA